MVNKAARIRAAGKPTGDVAKYGVPICRVTCEGCRKEIRSDGDLSDVEYVKTKRGTELFFHRSCMCRVWSRKIV